MREKQKMGFQKKLMLLLLGIILLSGSVFAAFYGISRQVLKKNMIAYSEVYVDSITSSITNMVREIDRLSMTFLLQEDMIRKLGEQIPEDSPRYVDYYNEVMASIERILNVRIDADGILIADSGGRVFTGGPNVPYRQGVNISQEEWYRTFMDDPEMFCVMPLHKTNADEVFSIARKLRSYSEMKINGVVRVDMKRRLLDEICRKNRLDQNSVALFDRKQNLFYLSGTDPGSRVMEEIQHRLDRESGPFQVVLGGQAWNISMEHSDYLDMYVAYIVPQDVLLRDLNELSRIAVMLLVLGGGLAVALAVGSSKVMSRGVSRVMEGIEAIERGNLDVEIQVDSNDEIRTIAAGLNHMAGRIKVLMEEKAQIEIKKKEAEIMMLQRQIRPHFLYNTLDGIRMKALLNQDHEAAEMIEKLSLLLRRTTDMKTEYVKVREELEYVTCYIELQNLRFRYKFQLDVQIPEDVMDMIIPKFSLQPLIENAVHHGLEKRRMNRQIRISSQCTDQTVDITVEDNGKGISPLRLEEIRATLDQPDTLESEHIGLNNINTRLKLYYGKEYGLRIDSQEGIGTALSLHLPRASQDKGEV
ncbi:sensor histidine kinase [Enterocloster citroniae]|uniref:histidine kinase n=2 Tax=Enterocloster citroniae TaxID=358743 RepID=A0ABV2FVC9_9FIRM|nr:sensor histidine kinase [Enterocloster citroniae]KMW11027.1 hypothetical protein HMPREF9470_00314 [[Clostridium] citroniae WAL-19142]